MAVARLGVGETLGALNAALGPGDPVWLKEKHARRLRARDFLAPRRALQARFGDGQVPERLVQAVAGLQGPGVAPVLRCALTPAGLALQLRRPAVFACVLGAVASYTAPSVPAIPVPRVVLHCPTLRGTPCALRLSQLRAVLVADHLARALRAQGVSVRLVPAVRDPHMATFLQQLCVDWPAAPARPAPDALRTRALAELSPARDGGALPPGALGTVCLKELVEERGRMAGYDPNLDSCVVTEDALSVLAELQEAGQQTPEDAYPGPAAAPGAGMDGWTVVHVVSCEEEFQQQKLDLLWWKLDDQAPLRQKHLVCGPVKVAGVPGSLTASEYYELRQAQVCKASARKHGRDLTSDLAWTEVFRVLSVASIKFEMLSTAPQSQLLLALADGTSTKGTRSGVFVMYNCARLATLFEGYSLGVEQGLYPAAPPASRLDFSLLRDEGEWLLLFNSILPFPDLLSWTGALARDTPGLHTAVRTETVCRFLAQLSMDFSSYYNRVHVLGEPRPHLFTQMCARLQLLRALREVLHAGLAMLGLPPLSHV
ncbi:DALR anticodon-binding domain-containing protein 3 isoform X2 [Manis pentadactyla]|uniref:DALR anticodon-binding domain-containing protein 3 isoform X2 n=1 Tax=Manis pentadactyla TaxID=143292 RepID=UPI00255CBF39|nr:DALR anticodon-binding domain-containing protein 3 isoform X2 [Manis pentadactyla]